MSYSIFTPVNHTDQITNDILFWSNGNQKALQFETADDVEAKVHEFNELLDPYQLNDIDRHPYDGVVGWDRFMSIYSIEPWTLMGILNGVNIKEQLQQICIEPYFA